MRKSDLKEIIREVIQEEIKKIPLIIANRAPNENDVYERGTTWLHGNDKCICKQIKI